MADKIEVTVLRQKVFHDGSSMVVLKPGEDAVDPRHLISLFKDGVIANPGEEALRNAAGLDFLADESEMEVASADTDVEALRDRIAELEEENEDLRRQNTDLLLEQQSYLQGKLLDAAGTPNPPPDGNLTDAPGTLNLSDEERARLPQLDHDHDGSPGGSTAQTGDDLPALREEYERLAGKRVFNGWDADTVRAKIGELKTGTAQTGEDNEAGEEDDEDDAPPA